MVSAEDVAKAEGELKVAVAQIHEAEEHKAVAEAELNLAKQILKEHTIVAPFDGVVIKRMKNPGESVRANEAVVEIGKLSRLVRQRLRPAQACLQGPGRADRRDPAQGRFPGGGQGGDREPEVPGQDHLRRSPDPGRRRDRPADPGRVRQSRLQADARAQGPDDHLPDQRRRLANSPAGLAEPAAPTGGPSPR